MGLRQRDTGYHTYADYLTWTDERRYELIDGKAYCLYDPKAMAPAPTRRHQAVLGGMFAQLSQALRGGPCRVYPAPLDVRLPKSDEADELVDTVVQPDISVICDPAKLDDAGCRGAPDWIIEVLSPSTASHDQIRKLAIYECAGVREYWLVHPVDRVVTIYRQGADGFGRPQILEMRGRTASTVIPGVDIDWALLELD